MNRALKRVLICAAIVLGSVLLTLSLSEVRFFQLLNLKAQDTNFVFRGRIPTKDIVLIGIDQDTLDNFPEPSIFWHKYYADAMHGIAEGGAKVMVLDVTFAIPVTKWEGDADQMITGALGETAATMPVICAFVPEAMGAQQKFVVPFNIMASAMGLSAFANLTADSDDFVRRQELIEAPKSSGSSTEGLARSMALRAVEKYLGKDAEFKDGALYVGNNRIPVGEDRFMTINYAGPPSTFPRVPLWKFIEAVQARDTQKLAGWVKDKIVLLGPDNLADRYSTPFYTFHSGVKATTPGFEIHANTIQTILSGNFLQPVPQWARVTALLLTGALCITAATAFAAVTQTALWTTLLLAALLVSTHFSFRYGWLFATSEILLAYSICLLGGVAYRFATAEKKSTFFRTAVAMFVGQQVATSLEESEKIARTGQRQMVTILFTDIRSFTAWCESRDPAIVVEELNVYLSKMVSIIVKNGGHVNKFIGDGILAVFSDMDPGSTPGDHALRCCRCAIEMVSEVVGDFRTGAGFHSGEVVIGNVGSEDKLEYTVLGDTVNFASRLESLNKDQHTRLLMSAETHEMIGGAIDTIYLGAVPVKGKAEKMKLFTVSSLLDEARLAKLREQVTQ
jgi:adenylate cyclase